MTAPGRDFQQLASCGVVINSSFLNEETELVEIKIQSTGRRGESDTVAPRNTVFTN